MEIGQLYSIFRQYPSIQTDSRKVVPGDIFFALKGENFNGNAYAMQALEMGAVCSVIDEDIGFEDHRLIMTNHVLQTLQDLARHHRAQFEMPFIGITGSNGKTTTKELIHAVLSSHFTTYTTVGNLNNHIGIPLTLLKIMPDAQIAVVEMGANHQHEIESYCKYVQPTHGIITNCGKAHLEGFGGIEGVRKGKGELYDYLRINQGTVFAFDDYEYLHQMVKGIEHVNWYGTRHGLVTGSALRSEPFLSLTIRGLSFDSLDTNLVGDYNLPNVLCAILVGRHFGVPDIKIKSAIEGYSPGNSRSQFVQHGTNKIILDAYNANPSSMKAAIENFARQPGNRKMLFLGGMMELGDDSADEHKSLVELIQQFPWEKVVLVGGDFKNIDHPFDYFNSSAEAAAWFKSAGIENAYILLKGSRSMQMEKLLL